MHACMYVCCAVRGNTGNPVCVCVCMSVSVSVSVSVIVSVSVSVCVVRVPHLFCLALWLTFRQTQAAFPGRSPRRKCVHR